MVGRTISFSKADRSFITLLATCLHYRARYLAVTTGFATPPMGLSPRELECLHAVAEGLSEREIAERLGISTSTAHEYVEGSKRKIQAKTRSEAVAVAASLGLLRV